ncbi:MAG: hypothetical protein ABI467_30320 [Kofleriaceae bacterium]
MRIAVGDLVAVAEGLVPGRVDASGLTDRIRLGLVAVVGFEHRGIVGRRGHALRRGV